jgi:hypothetical protein
MTNVDPRMKGQLTRRWRLGESDEQAIATRHLSPLRQMWLCSVALLAVLSASALLRYSCAQIVGSYNVGFSPRATLALGTSRVANTGVGQQHAWFGAGTSAPTYNPFGNYSPPVKPFSYPQFYYQNRPLVTSMDMARTEVLRGLHYGLY